jgi:hypothetical protein
MGTMAVRVLERRVLRGVLGLRLRDTAAGGISTPVRNGMVVTAWPLGGGAAAAAGLLRTAGPYGEAGICGFRSLPGLEAYVRGEKEAADFCAGGGAAPNFAVAIAETGAERRFLPQLHLLCLPRTSVLEAPLFSDPARSLGPAVGTLRGQVVIKPPAPADPLTAFTPGSYAVVQAEINGGPVVETQCDARGLFALFAPYPRPGVAPNEWSVLIRVRWEPLLLQPVPDVPLATAAGLPAHGAVLAQAHGQVFDAVDDAVPAAGVTRTLRLGNELLVASRGGQGRLYVARA